MLWLFVRLKESKKCGITATNRNKYANISICDHFKIKIEPLEMEWNVLIMKCLLQ